MRPRNKYCNGILNNCRATRLIPLFLILLGLFVPQAVGKLNTVNVLILPFEVRAPNEAAYLRTKIASVLAEHLERDGATIISLKKTDIAEVTNKSIGTKRIKQLAEKYAADQVIWGSFTLIGDSYSLDARMTAPSEKATPKTFSAQGAGLENLLNVLKTLSGKIGLKLFKHGIISDVSVQGNQRIETDAILRVVKTKAGSVYQRGALSQDLRAIYTMGWFDDVRIEVVPKDGSKAVIFHVKEKPVIRHITLKGNTLFDDEKIKENLTISTGAILNSKKINTNIEQIELLYKDKNYHDIKVDYKLRPLKKNQADLEFIIDEGDKLYITEIRFEGNNDFTDNQLKKVISTSEKGFFSWITSSGDFDRTALTQDTELLRQFYHNQGYIEARVADADIEFQPDGIHISFKISEGPQFKVGTVDITGDLLDHLDKDAIIKDLKITKAMFFSREKLREDITFLKDLYGASGYAYANIQPLTQKNMASLVVNITMKITKGEEVYFENITISGNTRTRDKVIRRQLRIYEQERFNSLALKRSIRNLNRLGFFEDIKVNTAKGSDDSKMDVKIEVTEQPTGMFSFGAGYSSEEKMFFMGEVSERNLFGRDQTLRFKGTFGDTTTNYTLSFTEPWLFDKPLSATISAYDQTSDYEDEYDRRTLGGGITFGYPLFDYTRGYIGYAYDLSDVTIDLVQDVYDSDEDGDTGELVPADVPDSISEIEGENVTSTVTIGLTYDSRDHFLNPTEGSKHRVSFEHAGLNGDIGFNKIRVETGWYWPLYKSLVAFAHAKYGYVYQYSDDLLLPDYEKFKLGGIYSIRGFKSRGIHLTEINSDGEEVDVGGNSMIQFNFELIFPIKKDIGFMGVVFFDAGNVYEDDIDFNDLRSSYGFGIRWFSPMAPIRIEYGRIIDRREGEEDGRWEFTMGGAF